MSNTNQQERQQDEFDLHRENFKSALLALKLNGAGIKASLSMSPRKPEKCDFCLVKHDKTFNGGNYYCDCDKCGKNGCFDCVMCMPSGENLCPDCVQDEEIFVKWTKEDFWYRETCYFCKTENDGGWEDEDAVCEGCSDKWYFRCDGYFKKND